jgi:hypothetical protein
MKKSQQSDIQRLTVTTLVTIAIAVTAVTAQAAYIVNATETGGDVVFEGSGSLDLTERTFISTTSRGAGVLPSALLAIGGGTGALSDDYSTSSSFISGPLSIGPGTTFTPESSGIHTGDLVTFYFDGSFLSVPTGIQSGDNLSGTSTFGGHTFATLGIAPGTYEWTWGSGATTDSYKLNVGAVPVPAAVWLFGSGLLGLIGIARKKAA